METIVVAKAYRIHGRPLMVTRRSLLKATAMGLPLAVAALAAHGPRPAIAQANSPKTFVLAHGSWHGGWGWKSVAYRLRANGHTVYTPDYTLLGHRALIRDNKITGATFVDVNRAVIQSDAR